VRSAKGKFFWSLLGATGCTGNATCNGDRRHPAVQLHPSSQSVGWDVRQTCGPRRTPVHTSLTCSATGESYAVDRLQNLSAAGKPLLAGYDLEALRDSFTPQAVRQRPIRSMWKFWDVLPVESPEQAISLGEGCTPL